MWLYVPTISTLSASAPVEADLISASNWQFRALEASVWWRGKPSQSRHWFQRWKKVSFIQRLFGRMPLPSTAEHGVALLTASLVASRASLIALPVGSKAATTPATSGQQRAVSSSSREHGLSSSKTSAACSRPGLTKSLARSEYSETFQSLVSRLREDCSRRQKSARAISVNASLSLQWRTPTDANETERGGYQSPDLIRQRHDAGHQVNLQEQAILHAASAWPTPTANDWKGSGPTLERKDGQMRGDRLDYATEQLWTTPSAGDGQRGGAITENMSGTSLVQQVNTLWSTPRASDAEKGGPNQAFGAGGQPLPSQTVSFHRDQINESSGGKSSPDRRSLNPLFVEWLMGWPPGWTLLAWIDLGCSETVLFHWKARMRSALLSLGLPREAPPAQLALFG